MASLRWSLALAAFLTLSAHLFSAPAEARPRACRANYVLDNAGKISTGWIDLGKVGGTFANKKRQCRKKAAAACQRAAAALPAYAPVGSANFQAICENGGTGVYFDTQVDGKRNSKDGSCRLRVSCTSELRCDACPRGTWEEGQYCVRRACSPVTPRPANDTSFLHTGYFFWDGELRQRIPRRCQTVWTGYAR